MNTLPVNHEQKPFSLRLLLCNAALIFPVVFLYTVKSDTPVYFIITAILLLFAFFRKEFLPFKDRPIIYSITAALILTVFPDMLITIDDSRQGFFDLVIRSKLAIPFFCYLAALSCSFYPTPRRTGFTAACVLGALAICGDRFNAENMNNILLSFLDIPLRNFRLSYALGAIGTTIMLPLYLIFTNNTATRSGPHDKHSPRMKRFWFILCMLTLPFSGFIATKFYYNNESFIRFIEYHVLRMGMKRSRGYGKHTLSSTANLNVPLPRNRKQDFDQVLFRIKAPLPPGYLRTAVWQEYKSGVWFKKQNPPAPAQLTVSRKMEIVSYSSFTKNTDPLPKDLLKAELYLESLMTGGIIPVPGNLLQLDAVADSGEMTEDGIFTLKQWKNDGGCTLFYPQDDPDTAWQGGELTDFKNISEPLKKSLAPFIPRSQGKSSDRKKINALLYYFSKFTYTLDNINHTKTPDPLIYFLQNSQSGHCEFFATATVLLLRSQGIPARYVTGFICEEKSSYGDYYIVRTSHAHAWCEAYLRDEKKWITVDPTPEDTLRSLHRTRTGFKSLWDSVKQLYHQLFADIRRGYFAKAVIDAVSGLFSLLFRFLISIPGIILEITLILYCIWRWRKYIRKKMQETSTHSPGKKKLAAAWRDLEKKYRKTTGEIRPPHITLQQFYSGTPLEELCREYENLRYSPAEPDTEAVQAYIRKSKSNFNHTI